MLLPSGVYEMRDNDADELRVVKRYDWTMRVDEILDKPEVKFDGSGCFRMVLSGS